MKKVLSFALALIMILTFSVAFAESYGTPNQAHTITVRSQGTGVHNYEVYQVFVGNLDAPEKKLSDIRWGSGVNDNALLSALQADDTIGSAFTSAATAEEVAKALEGKPAAFVEAFARVVSDNLTDTKATGASSGGNPNQATISVSGDGYYFVKDITPNLSKGDTFSKFMLDVVKDVSVVAKDTSFAPDKNIRKDDGESFTHVKANTSAIGDIVTFDVDIIIPDTSKYIDHFIMNMVDKLPDGLTFLQVDSVTIDGNDVPREFYSERAYNGELNGESSFVAITDPDKAVIEHGGQYLKVVFNGFKEYVETNNLIGKTLTVTYSAVVNQDAVFGPTGNENEVYYIYSTDPNYVYDGDEPNPDDDEPIGETPHSKTKTVVTQLKIIKIDGTTKAPLENARFRVSGTAYNTVIVTTVEYKEHKGMQSLPGRPLYWKLLDGSYTSTDPATLTNKTQYENVNKRYDYFYATKVIKVPTEVDVEGITNDSGELIISGLKPGTYTVEEINAPDGYNKIDEKKTLEITWTPNATVTDGTFGLTAESEEAGFKMVDQGVCYEITIENNSGTTLPSTGGIGTTIFYILGGLLVIGAAVILVARRKAQD